MKINKKLVGYLKNHRDRGFVRDFYGIFVNNSDIKDFKNYLKVISYRYDSLSASKISRLTKLSKRKIEHWIYEDNKPFIIKLLEHHTYLSKPKDNMRWLSINSTRGGLFIGPWIQVPDRIDKYNDVYKVIKQLKEIPAFEQKNNLFNIHLSSYKKEDFLAYLLGMMVGDSSKTGIMRKQRITRRIHIRLSKGYPTNEKLGEFTSLCANYLGLRMGKRKDCPAGKRNVYPFYTWISQSSTLIDWFYKACLGLKNNEKTTYDLIRTDWILKAPKNFKISFLQGLADSDGFVDFSSQQIGIITEPNTELVRNILDSLEIKSTPKFFTHNQLWSLMINIKDAYNLPLFNPIVRSYRYQYMEKLFKAKRASGHWPVWLKDKIEQNIKEGVDGTELVKKILNEEGIAIRTKSIYRRAKKLREQTN